MQQTFINFNIEYPEFTINRQDTIIKGIESIIKEECFDKKLFITFIFLSDDELLVYNKQYLDHDYYTDIITFPIEETDDYLEADLLLSVDRIMDNAKQLKIDNTIEVNRVIIHGVLHLIGYNDKAEEEQKLMRSREDYYLSKLFF